MPNPNDVPAGWYATLAAVVALVPVEGFVTFALWFAPGWANGWPYPKHVVWSTGMAILLFAALMTGAVAIGAIYAIVHYRGRSLRRTRSAFAVWVAVSAVVAALHCLYAGRVFYQRISQAGP